MRCIMIFFLMTIVYPFQCMRRLTSLCEYLIMKEGRARGLLKNINNKKKKRGRKTKKNSGEKSLGSETMKREKKEEEKKKVDIRNAKGIVDNLTRLWSVYRKFCTFCKDIRLERRSLLLEGRL